MSSGILYALIATSALASTTTLAADNPASHQHGHAQLQLAISGNQVDLLFLSPAYNVVGFEHHARTQAQRQEADAALFWLEQTPLVNTSKATCTVHAAAIQYEVAGADEHNEDKHSQHADFEVTQVLDCPGLEEADSLTTSLTSRFPGLEHLEVAWAGPDGQGSTRLKHGEDSVSLGR